MVTVLSLASARSSTTAFSVNGQNRFQNSAAKQAAIQAAAAMMIIIFLAREDCGDGCVLSLVPGEEEAALVRTDYMNVGLRNACEMLET
jgi:hypothetical protein